MNPILDRENTTALTAVELVASALGQDDSLTPATRAGAARATRAAPGHRERPVRLRRAARGALPHAGCAAAPASPGPRDSARSADSLRRHVAHRLPPLVERAGAPVDGHVLERLERQPGTDDERLEPSGIGTAGTGRARRDRGAPSARARAQTAPAGGHPVVARRLGPHGDRRRPAGSQDTPHLGERPARRRRRASGRSGRARRPPMRRGGRSRRRRARGSRHSSTPSSAARRRAASTISGATSVESRRPDGPSRSAARKPVSPGPAASSRIVSPGRGSSSSTMRSEIERVASQNRLRRRSQPPATPRQASRPSDAGAHAAAPANCGITSLPYAASVSSCPCVIR